jgi:hypothetical protein
LRLFPVALRHMAPRTRAHVATWYAAFRYAKQRLK